MKTATPPMSPESVRTVLLAEGLTESPTRVDGQWFAYKPETCTVEDVQAVLALVSKEYGRPTQFYCDDRLVVFASGTVEPAEPVVVPERHCSTCRCGEIG